MKKPHIPDWPTEAEVGQLLELMMTVYTGVNSQIGRRIVWCYELPAALRNEIREKKASFVVDTENNEFLIGYKGPTFFEPGPIFIPPPADRMERYVWPGPKIPPVNRPAIVP